MVTLTCAVKDWLGKRLINSTILAAEKSKFMNFPLPCCLHPLQIFRKTICWIGCPSDSNSQYVNILQSKFNMIDKITPLGLGLYEKSGWHIQVTKFVVVS